MSKSWNIVVEFEIDSGKAWIPEWDKITITERNDNRNNRRATEREKHNRRDGRQNG